LKLVRKELWLEVECRLKRCRKWRRVVREDGQKLKLVTSPVGIKNVREKGLMKRLKGALSERFVVIWQIFQPPAPVISYSPLPEIAYMTERISQKLLARP
jgi:hypothetical protein